VENTQNNTETQNTSTQNRKQTYKTGKQTKNI